MQHEENGTIKKATGKISTPKECNLQLYIGKSESWKEHNIKKVQHKSNVTWKKYSSRKEFGGNCTRWVHKNAQTDNGPFVNWPWYTGWNTEVVWILTERKNSENLCKIRYSDKDSPIFLDLEGFRWGICFFPGKIMRFPFMISKLTGRY